jgi:hypothetical protein
MGLNIRLHNINLKNNFKLSYRIGNTSGDVNTINSGYTNYTIGATLSGNTVYPSSDVRDYETNPIIFTGATFNTQYWFKFLDQTTGLYTIENINTHESKYYECYDKIDFYVTVTGDICDTPLNGDVFNPTITLYDYLNDTGYYGNHSSMTGSTGSVYNVYTGNTSDINGTSTGLIKSGATTNQSNGIIHSFNYTVNYPPTLPMQPLYVFVEHMDGSVWNGNNTNPKKQGGFEVKRVRMENIFDYVSTNETQTPLPTSTLMATPTSTPISPTATPTSTPIISTSTPTPTPTSTPITPTSTPIIPTSTPITPTSTPIIPTSTPITPTSTPVSTTKFIVKKCAGSGGDGVTSYKVQIAPNATLNKSYTLYGGVGVPADMDGYNCWYVESTVTDTTSPDYTLNYHAEYNDCGSCSSVSLLVYSGNSLPNVCASTTEITVYYRGTLGVDTILYTTSNLSDEVETPGYYKSVNNGDIYHVGVAGQYPYIPSPGDGWITDIQLCPTPTPTPIPSYTFNLYVSETSGAVACAGGDTPAGSYHQFVITGNTTNFCTSTSFTCDFITSYDLYQFWVSDGTNSRSLTRNGGQGIETASPDGACSVCGSTPTPTPTSTPTPTPTATPSLPAGVLGFGSSDSNYQQCDGLNNYEYNRTYYVDFTSARSMGGYVVVYLNDNSNIQLPFNQSATSASLTVSCGCGSDCASIEYVMNVIYITPTQTPEPLLPTSTPTEGGGGEVPLEPT